MNPSDEIKSKLDIVDVLREYIQLKPAGINFRANCPFHNEKSPSFMVSPEKQIWHCFGCAKGGDIFSFVMEMEGVSFIEALRILAPKAGVELRSQDPKMNSERNRLLDAMNLAGKYYNHQLKESKAAAPAREYLKKRGLTEQTIDEWQIGYSHENWEDLVNFLKSRGFNDIEIFKAGLSIKKENSSRYYNRFRGRIMFPIKDANGNIVAFTARVSPEKEKTEKLGKYINSPQSQIYDKSKVLFGLDRAKNFIRNEDLAIIVEGQMDVITAFQNGFKNVIASSGTALTADQIEIIKRYTKNIALALDSDSAGQAAIVRGEDVVKSVDYQEVDSQDDKGRIRRYIDQNKSFNIDIKIIEIPNGKDPDECIKNNPDEWRQAVAGAKDVMQFHFDRAIEGVDTEKIENRRKITQNLLPKIAKLAEKDKTEQDFWIKKLSQKLGISEIAVREELSKYREVGPDKAMIGRNKTGDERKNKLSTREELLSELLLALAIKFPEHINYVLNNIQLDQLIGQENIDLYKRLIIYYNKVTENTVSSDFSLNPPTEQNLSSLMNYKDFRAWLVDADGGNPVNRPNSHYDQINQPELLDRLALLAEKDFFDCDSLQAKMEIIKITVILRKNYLRERLKEIESLIAKTEKEKDGDRMKLLLEEFKSLADELKETDNI